jgi:hypothetical protein
MTGLDLLCRFQSSTGIPKLSWDGRQNLGAHEVMVGVKSWGPDLWVGVGHL